jgi:hypothetical protein
MKSQFSDNLILRIKQYYLNRFDRDITTEEAVVFLSSFADLFEVVLKKSDEPRFSNLRGRRRLYLINSILNEKPDANK